MIPLAGGHEQEDREDSEATGAGERRGQRALQHAAIILVRERDVGEHRVDDLCPDLGVVDDDPERRDEQKRERD